MRRSIPLYRLLPLLFLALPAALPAQDLAPLIDKLWVLHSIEHDGGARVLPVPGYSASIALTSARCPCDPTRFTGEATGGCNTFGFSYLPAAAGSINFSTGSSTLRHCGDGALDFDRHLGATLENMTFYAVGTDWLRLWNSDSTVVVHFGLAPRTYAYGARIQVFDFVPAGASDVFVNGGASPVIRTLGFGTASVALWLANGITRITAALQGNAPYFDTTLVATDVGDHVIYVRGGTGGGAPRGLLRERAMPDTTERLGTVQVHHATPLLGDAAVRLDSHGLARILEVPSLTVGGFTMRSPVATLPLRLRVSRQSSGAVYSFMPTQVASTEAFTYVMTGSPETGDFIAWNVQEWPLREAHEFLASGVVPRTSWGRAVNLTDQPMSVSMMNVARHDLPPMSGSVLDEDMMWGDIEMQGPGETYGRHRFDGRITLPGAMTVIRHHADGAFGDLVARYRVGPPEDSAYAGWILIGDFTAVLEAGGRRLLVEGVTQYAVQPGTVRLNVYRTGASGMEGVGSVTYVVGRGSVTSVIVAAEGDSMAAWLLIDSDKAAQIPVRRLAVGPPPPLPPEPPTGRIMIANATLDADSLRVQLDESTSIAAWKRTTIGRSQLDTGLRTGAIGLYVPTIALADSFTVVGDTSVLLLAVGSDPQPAHRLLTLLSPIAPDPIYRGPWIRFVNALEDLVAVDVAGLRGPRVIPEVRMRPFDWTEHVAVDAGAIHLEMQHVAGSRYFYADDTLRDDHRYTAVLVGSLARPVLLVFDDEVDERQSMRTFAITGNTADVRAEAERRSLVRPNPARTHIEIVTSQTHGHTTIELVDDLGNILRRDVGTGTVHRVHLDGVAAGVYTIVARDQRGIVARERVVVIP